MSREYIKLECGCLISCDGGGGIVPVCSGLLERDPNCKIDEYIDKHNVWCGGYCKKCHSVQFNLAIVNGEEITNR